MRKPLLLLLVLALSARTEDSPTGPHGGTWLDVPGAATKFEIVFQEERRRAVAYVLEPDGKTPAALKNAPELKLDALDDKAPLSGKALKTLRAAGETAWRIGRIVKRKKNEPQVVLV